MTGRSADDRVRGKAGTVLGWQGTAVRVQVDGGGVWLVAPHILTEEQDADAGVAPPSGGAAGG